MAGAAGDRGPDRWDLGRLDLDDLESVDLDLLDSDDVRPAWATRRAALLEGWGVTPFARRHRRGLSVLAALAVAAAASATVWWLNRPAPLAASPKVAVRAIENQPDSLVVTSAPTRGPVALTQRVAVTVTEPAGVAVTLLHLVGPGLTAGGEAPAPVDRAGGTEQQVSAAFDCATPEGTTAAVGARDDSYAVQVQRRGPAGDVRTDDVPLVGVTGVADLVRSTCLQTALDRDVRVTNVTATPVAGMVAADLVVTLTNDSPRVWSGLAVAPAASPQLVNGGASTGLSPRSTGTLRARLQPLDCAHPAATLDAGLPVRADLPPSGIVPPDAPVTPTLRLAVPRASLDTVAAAFAALCGPARPTATAVSAIMSEGGDATTAGTLEIAVVLRGLSATSLDADHPWVVSDGGGLDLASTGSPLPVVDGVARLTLLWQAPRCADVAAHQSLHMQVIAISKVTGPSTLPLGGLRPQVIGPSLFARPYTIAVGGEPLRTRLAALCGHDVASVIA